MRPTDLFEAMGARLEADAWVYRYDIGAETYEIRIFDSATMLAPTESTTSWTAVDARGDIEPSKASEFFDIALTSMDARDIMAFCIGSENSMRFGVLGDQVDDDMGFEYEGSFIHQPFTDEQYGIHQGKAITDWPHNADGRAILLTPATQREWADQYVAWRDSLAEKLLQAHRPAATFG